MKVLYIQIWLLHIWRQKKTEEIVFAAELWKVTEIAAWMNYVTKIELYKRLTLKKKKQ